LLKELYSSIPEKKIEIKLENPDIIQNQVFEEIVSLETILEKAKDYGDKNLDVKLENEHYENKK
jgi:hypothetical protein